MLFSTRLLRNGHPFVGRQCPICRTPLGAFSPVGHLITACTDPRIQAYRDTIGFSREFFVLLWQHAHEVAGLLPAPDVNSLDLSILVLGGTLCGGATLGNDWLAGFSQMGTVVAPPAGRVVHFLQRTMWSYSSSLWAYHRNAAARLLRNGHPFVGRQCPICRTPLGAFSPVGHLITACTDPRIQAYRDTIGFSREFFVLLWQHAHEVAGLLPAPDVNSLDLSILVLGGTLCGGATLGNDWLAGFSQMGTVVAPPAGRVVHFLQRTMWSYSSSLWAYHRNAAVGAPPPFNTHPFVGRQCPICRTPLGAFSPVGHLITACTDPRIQAYRDTIGFSREFFVLLWQHAHEVAGLLPAPDVNSLDLSILVLGGTLCGGATLGNDWLAGFSQMGTVVAPPAGRVVHFLQRTMWSYSSSLWAYHRNAAGQ
ncbi:hypothetical protein HK105_206209 [Polyrhizophydium stewartii]|uniref:Reverse transcriptase zinc-binding domain-containing protein n=1 Tax=Polyrhizophydium stewartii TaxID=2732419 RepID=A0ABR4N434_9FUNG